MPLRSNRTEKNTFSNFICEVCERKRRHGGFTNPSSDDGGKRHFGSERLDSKSQLSMSEHAPISLLGFVKYEDEACYALPGQVTCLASIYDQATII
jgi:hypothetical protein